MKKIKEYTAVYAIGACGYSLLEILWRGFTHWTMTLTGGICFVSIYFINHKSKSQSLLLKCLKGCGIITLIELVVGILVNRTFNLNVWNYSDQKFNILGQVCLLYTSLWFLLCIPLIGFSKTLKKRLS